MMIQQLIEVMSPGRGLINVTPQIKDIIANAAITTGICHLFLHHTSASIIICENFDPTVQADLEDFMRRLAPDGDPVYQHTAEGPDDMPSHIRTVLTQNSISIPITQKQLNLGKWQSVYIWEHRFKPHLRKLTVTLQGVE